MLKTTLIHPEILGTLGRLGHGSKVLIADGNYPFATGSNPAAKIVFLNLRAGLLNATDVLAALVTAIPVEAAHVMNPQTAARRTSSTNSARCCPIWSFSASSVSTFTIWRARATSGW